MSGVARVRATLGTRALQAFVLAAVGAVAVVASRSLVATGADHGVDAVAAVGVLLLAGTLTSELVEVLRIPHLTGYLLAGVVAGPHVLGVVGHGTVEALSRVNVLALALIALEGGAHLRTETLRASARSLAWATLFQTGLVMVGMIGVFLAARPLLPWAAGFTPAAYLGVALLWAVLAVTRSPAAVLGVLAQTRAVGPVATRTLAFVMVSDVVVVVTAAIAFTFARPLVEPTGRLSLHEIQHVFHEVLGSVALGATLGLALAAYLRLFGRQLVVVLLALGFGFSEAARYLRFDSLLAFMVAGFLVQNLTAQGPKLLRATEGTGAVVYVVFFATAGAHLDLPLLATLWQVALVLAASRAAITVVADRIATRMAKDPPIVRRWGFAGLVSQAGLALGVAVSIERAFPAFGASFRTLAVATIAINEVIGPVLMKFALDRAGETVEAPAEGDPERAVHG